MILQGPYESLQRAARGRNKRRGKNRETEPTEARTNDQTKPQKDKKERQKQRREQARTAEAARPIGGTPTPQREETTHTIYSQQLQDLGVKTGVP